MRAALPYIGCQKAGGASESLKLLLIQGKDIRTAVRMVFADFRTEKPSCPILIRAGGFLYCIRK